MLRRKVKQRECCLVAREALVEKELLEQRTDMDEEESQAGIWGKAF